MDALTQLAGHDLFSGLDAPSLCRLLERSETCRVSRGETI